MKFCEFNPKNGVQGVGDLLMTGSLDGVINLWNLSVGAWRSNRESAFNLEDKSRLILTIDENKGCRRTREVRSSDKNGVLTTEYTLEEVNNEGSYPRDRSTYIKSICDCVRWSVHGRFAISSV